MKEKTEILIRTEYRKILRELSRTGIELQEHDQHVQRLNPNLTQVTAELQKLTEEKADLAKQKAENEKKFTAEMVKVKATELMMKDNSLKDVQLRMLGDRQKAELAFAKTYEPTISEMTSAIE